MGMLWLCLLACGPTEPTPVVPAPSGRVEVHGLVRGWDGSGDVAIEACGRGALVDEETHGFGMWTESDCTLRVVWERDGQRAEGAWHELPAPRPDGIVAVVLPMPEELVPLSPEERAYREHVIREAQRQLDAGEEGSSEVVEAGPGV